MHNEKRATRFSSGALILVLLQVLFLIFYALIIAIVSVYFQGEISETKYACEQLKTALNKVDETGPSTREKCICKTERDQGHLAGKDIDEVTTSWNLLSCCSADQETLKLLIVKVFDEERRRNRDKARDRNRVTLGQVERLVESMVRRNTTQLTASSGVGNVIPVATHVTGTTDCFKANEPIGAMFKVGQWSSANGISFDENVYSDGYHMVVPKSGTYHVYSQVGFQDQGSVDDTEFMEYLHYTVLISTSYSSKHIDLMKSVRIGDGTYGSLSSFHSGLFKLKEGDKIYMKVYLPSSDVQLDCRQESTYMGMYLVSDEQRV
ncbi:tumor necrosis factor ligand superfamily member 10-like [Ptychodera flava]|uniref:tumor necrosis factor ligand superfamily member 10-like n=1 Tax=Ptychodera flava TaxID=63121 RepID=UPI00396A09BA